MRFGSEAGDLTLLRLAGSLASGVIPLFPDLVCVVITRFRGNFSSSYDRLDDAHYHSTTA
jgi:hypothetical protein